MAPSRESDSPSTAAIAVAAALISGVAGYYLGQAGSIGVFGTAQPAATSAATANEQASDSEDDEEDEEDEDLEQPLDALETFPGNNEECKLVMIVRTDLGMTKGKIAAQCSHATLGCYKTLYRANPAHPLLERWERLGQAKIALKVDSEEDLLVLQARALSVGLCAQVIRDAGRTQIPSGSTTVLGIGPAPRSKIDEVTGHLKLL